MDDALILLPVDCRMLNLIKCRDLIFFNIWLRIYFDQTSDCGETKMFFGDFYFVCVSFE